MTSSFARIRFASILVLALIAARAIAQTDPLTIDLPDALVRAKKFGLQIESAGLAVKLAAEDRKQAKAATLPQVSGLNQFIYTEGNGTPSGVFVGADGVHVYNEQLQAHEELLAFLRKGEVRRAMAAEATARARVDLATRGLTTTVVQDYYAIVSAQRKLVNAQTSLKEAERFQDISQKLENGGEVAHADVIKAQLQRAQRQRDLQDSELAVAKAKIALSVLIFPELREDFGVVDDIATMPVLPPVAEASALATSTSPDLKIAQSSLREAVFGVTIARYAYLPSFGLDVFYGIGANQFASTSSEGQATGRSTLPNYEVSNRQNLGYQAVATLNIPIWNWGSIRSRVKQASLRQEQAKLDLTLAQRTLRANVTSAHREAQAAQAQVQSLRESSDLAADSLRLTVLRYQAGEATALEVVDAQTTVTLARNAYDDGMVRYRVAVATLQTITGSL